MVTRLPKLALQYVAKGHNQSSVNRARVALGGEINAA
jgi:hypothetical protein